jgi:hypothetical protein
MTGAKVGYVGIYTHESQQKLGACGLCHGEITGATVYAEDGARLCEKCAGGWGGSNGLASSP